MNRVALLYGYIRLRTSVVVRPRTFSDKNFSENLTSFIKSKLHVLPVGVTRYIAQCSVTGRCGGSL
jgi:hypothetical protein